jgi:hypothetical protein
MDAVALSGKVDPDCSDRIVWTWWYLQLLLDVDAAQAERGIVLIHGVLSDLGHLELSFGRRTILAAHSYGIDC